MNKLLFYFIFFFGCITFAKAPTTEPKTKAQAKVIRTDASVIVPRTFRTDLSQSYKSNEFQYDPLLHKNSKWENFKAWLNYWINRLFSLEGKDSGSSSETIYKVIAVIVVLFVVGLIAKIVLDKEGQWIFGKSSQKKIAVSDTDEEDIHNIDFETIISKSKRANDHRLSIRYYYLWLLKRMSDRALIEWDIEKTNSDYLYEIKREELKEEFRYLSYIYDHSWYGEFAIDDLQFAKAEKAFVKTIKSI